jgi:LCP family protein required for cell wall assembly
VLLPILLLVLAVGGFIYARNVFNRIEKVEVADVLSQGGEGTNYLIVGSDSRDLTELEEAGLNPEAFEDGGGQRSDTIMLLRFADGGAKMMSIPRDLFVELAETGGSGKINAAYNGGPRRLILTVQQALNIPVHHYLEVDFVSFASLVDHLGGVTIEFPNPAFDRNSGLDVQQAGQVKLDGPQALAFVRSRNYVEVVDGRERADATGDLGRVTRQQQFLTAVLGKLGKSKNPYSVARAAGSLAGGLRIDDRIDLLEAARLAWRLRGVDPEPVVLPTDVGRNSAGSVLFLAEPEAETVLAGFR